MGRENSAFVGLADEKRGNKVMTCLSCSHCSDTHRGLICSEGITGLPKTADCVLFDKEPGTDEEERNE